MASEVPPPATRAMVVLVTGLSGAGRTSALRVLEDEGFEAVDNLPLSLLPALLAPLGPGDPDRRVTRIAVGVDLRTRGFEVDRLILEFDRLRDLANPEIKIVFLDCDTDILVRRFTETRRRHPLATDRPVSDGIRSEREVMGPLRDRADLLVDTSNLTLGEFRGILLGSLDLQGTHRMTVTVVSFSYRKGIPRESDLVFDVRFLTNPYYDQALRPRDGRDPEVGRFVAADPGFAAFEERLTGFLELLLPRYEIEGKSYLTVAIGCTGGRHRSVFVAERLAAWLKSHDTPVTLRHRDLPNEPVGMQGGTDEATHG